MTGDGVKCRLAAALPNKLNFAVTPEVVRRRVLTAMIHIALAPLGVLFGGRLAGAGSSPPSTVPDNLVQVLSNRISVIHVGAAYLATAPGETDPNVVIERMRRHGDALVRALETGNPGRARRLAARDCRADFAEGRIVKVDGWLLSQTEARLCALTLMLCSGSPWPQRAVGF